MAVDMEMLEHKMKQTMIDVDERATDSVGSTRVGDTPVPRPPMKDGGGGASSEKPHAPPPKRAFRMDSACCYVPDHDEDAYFVHRKAGFIGVADGVGGYRDEGVDAAAFARALMKYAHAGASAECADPYSLLQEAYLKAAGAGTPGASTAVILSLRGATLRWAYIGDSAFAVFRDGKMVHRSKPQQSYFNCPFQLASANSDRVEDAVVGEMPVMEDDVVVVGTDGLFDNVFDMDLARIVRNGAEMAASAQNLAEKIAAAALVASKSWGPTPFSVARSRNEDGKEQVCGGKPDDITVIVAYIVPKNS